MNMTKFAIELEDERVQKLHKRAEKSGLTPEMLLRARVEAWLDDDEKSFEAAATYVLKKNAELYRRLA
jgi:predicted transcriptional regulator